MAPPTDTIVAMLKRLPPDRAAELVERASVAPLSNPRVSYPRWYLRRWHFLPEGYLSRRSAAGYDHLVRPVYTQMNERSAIAAVVKSLKNLAPRSVLEVGCGPGHMMKAIAESGLEADLVGIDLSPFLLERARKRVPRGRVRYVHADGTSLPAGEGEFDAVVASHYVGHMPADVRDLAAAELARVVRPGGSVIVVEHPWHSWPKPSTLRSVAANSLNFGLMRVSEYEHVEIGAR